MHTSALVLFSGGQDSATCLAHALQRYERVETIAFDYRQRHHVELESRLAVLSELRNTQGVGITFPKDDKSRALKLKIEEILGAHLASERPTQTI